MTDTQVTATGSLPGVAGRRMILPVDEDELVACVACGLCLPHCPTYRVTGLEVASPRGRIAAMRAVELEGAPLDGTFERYMEECIQCRGCEAACPSSVPFGHLMEGARTALQRDRSKTRPAVRRIGEWIGYRLVLPRHRLLLALTWILVVAQRMHLVPRRFALPRLDPRSLRSPVDAAPPSAADAYLFTGCVMDAWERDVHRAALRVMRAAGANPAVPGRGGDCCGALHEHAGRTDEARELARRVIGSMPGDAPVVVDSAGCGAAMKDYGRLLGTPEAFAFGARVRDFSEWLAERGAPRLRATGRVVVVQDPCHLRHVQKAHQHVRTVLAPAYELRETDDDGLCCGAGGAYNVMEPELARQVRERKIAALRAAAGGSPFVVASANPGCEMHLRAAGLDVAHPAELLAAALATEGE
ncbi:MAG TPA: (Fe-S)-binding protein [Acidimicrobiia bacterium]|nr:(Fe-S)-binding protein [Acidimicrobiia bacterium]